MSGLAKPPAAPRVGIDCPAGHGPLLLLSDGRLYCPHQSHDAERLRPAIARWRSTERDAAPGADART